MHPTSRLEERLESIERQLRIWRRAALFVGAVMAVMFIGWAPVLDDADTNVTESIAQPPTGETTARDVVTQRIKVVDEKGRTRIELGAYEAGPAIRMLDEDGELRAAFFVNPVGPGLSMIDDDHTPRIGMSILGDVADFRLMDEDGEAWAVFAEKKGRRMFALTDERRRAHVGMTVNDGAASMTVTGRNNQGIAARANDEGSEFIMSDSQGKEIFRKP